MNCKDCCYDLPKDGHSYCTYEDGECVKISVLEKENAELRKVAGFGYNKAKAEIKLLKETHRQSLKILTDQIEELHKANEWHYVKDGKPKDNEYVLIYTDLKNTYVARIPTEKDYFVTRRGGFVQMSAVIAWKEIVLPELREEDF